MKIKIVKMVEAEDCTNEFLLKGENTDKNHYFIAKISDNHYAVVSKANNDARIEFKSKMKIYERTWLLTLLDDTQCIMYFDEDSFILSGGFLRTIKIFKDYLLIEKTEGKRCFIKKKDCTHTFDWFNGLATDYNVLRLPNRKCTIIKKEGLQVADFECEGVYNILYPGYVIIFDNKRKAVVRLSDLEKSTLYYSDIWPYCIRGIYSSKYVCVNKSIANKKVYIMRLKDFKLSSYYDNCTPITFEYALMEKDGKEEILRLSDFKVAKYD